MIVETVAKLYLEPLVEPSFHPDSYGYRPRKSALDAVGSARQRCWRYAWVIDLDIRGFFNNLDHELRYLENRLFQVKLDQEEAARRVATLQAGLRGYMLERGAVAVPGGQESPAGSQVPPTPGTPAMIPQFGESFLDRLVAISSQNSDVQYLQQLTDQIIAAGQVAVSFEKETAYYEDMMASVRRLNTNASVRGGTPDRQAVATIKNRFDEIYTGVVRALEQANAVYEELSRHNLNPRTNLYTITSSFSITTQRALTLRTLALYGLLTLMMSVLLVPLACLIHHYFRREILPRRMAAAPRERRSEERAPLSAEKETVERTV